MIEGDHVISATKEVRRPTTGQEKTIIRWRARCSCGVQTHMHYSEERFAKAALKRTHLADLNGHE